MIRCARLAGWLLLATLVLAGCALPKVPAAGASPTDGPWSGRLALRVDSDPVRTLAGGFELSGNAQSGELRLLTPLGSTVSSLSWTPASAHLRSQGEVRSFASLDELSRELTGAELPVAALFQWLAGQDAASAGWQADLSQLDSGRLTARRTDPAPAAELRLVLDR